jgi:hypothetical protein
MSELYGASETAEPVGGTRTAPVRGASSGRETGSYSDAAQDGYGDYGDDDAEAFLAAEQRQPESRTRQEAAADTWGDDDADDYADSDLAAEYDGDVEALLAEEDALAESRTRLEAAAATWDDTIDPGDGDPDAYSGDPASEYDGDVVALLAAEQRQPEPRTRQEVAADTWGDADGGQDGGAGESTGDTTLSQSDAVTETPASGEEGEDGTSDPYASETGAQDTQQTARVEQPLASTDRHPGDGSTPEHGADDPGSQQQQDAVRAERKGAREVNDVKRTEGTGWRHAVVEETFGVGALLVDAYDLTTKIAAHAPVDMVFPAVATVLGGIAVGKAIAKNRKGKDE